MPDVSRGLPGLAPPVDDAGRVFRAIPTFAPSNGASELAAASTTQIETFAEVDMSALAGISPHQLAAIVQLIQSGALPAGSSSVAPVNPPPQAVSTVQPLDDLRDCEDGEIVDGGSQIVKSTDREGTTTRASDSNMNGYSARGKENFSPSCSAQPSTQRVGNGVASVARQYDRSPHSRGEDEAKDFIMKLHQFGYGFDVLSKHVTNRSRLQQLYAEVGISVDGTNGTQQPPQTTRKPLPTLATASRSGNQVEQGLPPKSATPPKNTTPIARSEYLAKLAAAKAKTNGTVKPVQNNVKVKTPEREDTASKLASDRQPTPRAATVKSAATTDLIRQRLEALRASQATKNLSLPESKTEQQPLALPTASQPSNGGSTSKPEGSWNGVRSLVANAPEVYQNTGEHGGKIVPVEHVHRLPGLFMATSPLKPGLEGPIVQPPTPAAQSSGTNAQRAFSPSAETRKRSRSVTRSGPPEPMAKRPFGQSRPGSDDEQLIITPSDDEDEFDEDNVRTDSASAAGHLATMSPNAALLTTTHDATAQYSSFESNQPSAYDKKVEEIAAIRRLIEEREKRARVGRKAGKSSRTSISPSQPAPDKAVDSNQVATLLANPATKLDSTREALPQSSSPTQHDAGESDMPLPAKSGPILDDHALDDPNSADRRGLARNAGNGLSIVNVLGEESQSSDEMDTSSESNESSIEHSNHNAIQNDNLTTSSESGSDIDEEQSQENSTEAQDYDGSSDEMDTNTDGDDSDHSASDYDPPPGDVRNPNDALSTDLNMTQHRPDKSSPTYEENLLEPQNKVRDEESLTHLPEHNVNREMRSFVVEVPTDPTPASITQPSAQERRSRAYFTRYESPLIKFRTGIASPVSMQSKDAAMDDILCPYETTGGRCNDRTCQYRHFSTLGLSGA